MVEKRMHVAWEGLENSTGLDFIGITCGDKTALARGDMCVDVGNAFARSTSI
jgi:hypothetical protein